MKTPFLKAMALLFCLFPSIVFSQTPATPDMIYAVAISMESPESVLGTLDPSTAVFTPIATISDLVSEDGSFQVTGISIDENGIIHVIALPDDEPGNLIFMVDAVTGETTLVDEFLCSSEGESSSPLGSLAFVPSGDLFTMPIFFATSIFNLTMEMGSINCDERFTFDFNPFEEPLLYGGLERNRRNDSLYTVRSRFPFIFDDDGDQADLQALREVMPALLPEGTPLDLFRYDPATNVLDSVFRFEVTEDFQFFVDVVFDSDENFYAFSLGIDEVGSQIYSLDMENGIMAGATAISGADGIIGAALAPPDDGNGHGAAVPTLSQWGMVILGLLMLIFGVAVIRKLGRSRLLSS